MKSLFILITSLVICFSGNTQEVEMVDDWSLAKNMAHDEDKNILVILTGSSWCAPCKKMDKNVIPAEEFQKFAKENLIIFIVDLPGGGIYMNSKVFKDYDYFKEQFTANALPSLILTDKNGVKIKTLEGKMHRLDNVMSQLYNK